MRFGRGAVIEQRYLQIDLPIAIVVVFDRVEKPVVIGVSVLDDLFYFWRQRFWTRCLPAAMVFRVFIDGPGAPFSAKKMQLAIEWSDIEFATARVVLVEL